MRLVMLVGFMRKFLSTDAQHFDAEAGLEGVDDGGEVPGGDAARHVGEGAPARGAGPRIRRGAEHERAPDEGEEPDQPHDREHGGEQRVVVGAAPAIAEARGARRRRGPDRLSLAAPSQEGSAAMTMQIRKHSAVPVPDGAWNLSSEVLKRRSSPCAKAKSASR